MSLEQERDAFAYAVWMVGNMDTPEDKAAWWADFSPLWDRAAQRVEEMHKRGVIVGDGFAATELDVIKPKRTKRSDYIRLMVGGGVLFHLINTVVASLLGYPHLTDTMFPEALPVFLVGMAVGWWIISRDDKDRVDVA